MITPRIPDRRGVSSAFALRAVAVFALSIGLATAASSKEDDPARFGDVVDVSVVNVEAVVLDRDGNRVYGLGPDDFRLLVDDQEVPIDYFTEVQGGRAVAATFREGEAIQTLPSLDAGAPVGNSYLVFIDEFFGIATQRNLVIENLLASLPTLRPEDRMAVVAYDGATLDMLTSWTSSVPTLTRALEGAKKRTAYGLFRRAELINGFAGFDNSNFARNRERRLQLERITEAVVSTLRGFAQPPGRKVLLMLSGAWPSGRFIDAADTALGGSETDLTLTRPIDETANLLGYTVYPVDMAGLSTTRADDDDLDLAPEGFVSAGFAGNEDIDRQRRRDPAAGLTPDIERQSALRAIAAATGGRALFFRDRLEALPKVAEDTASYYWLGFTPDRQRDDMRHRIRVELVRPGLKVRNRRDYRDLSRAAEVDMMAQSALLFGDSRTLSALVVQIGTPSRKGLSRMIVPVQVAIPLDQVTMIPTTDGLVADLELRLMAKDRYGSRTDVATVPIDLIGDEDGVRGVYHVETDLKMRRAPHDLVVALYDKPSGSILTSLVAVAP